HGHPVAARRQKREQVGAAGIRLLLLLLDVSRFVNQRHACIRHYRACGIGYGALKRCGKGLRLHLERSERPAKNQGYGDRADKPGVLYGASHESNLPGLPKYTAQSFVRPELQQLLTVTTSTAWAPVMESGTGSAAPAQATPDPA